MRFIEKLAICIAGCLGVFFIGLIVLFLGRTPVQGTAGRVARIVVPAPTATPDCRREIAEYNRATLAPLMAEWEDAFTLANNSPRIALAPQIATLQAIRRKLLDAQPAPCARETHQQFVTATDEIVAAFLAFLGQEPEYTVNRHFKNATALLEKVKDAINESETLN
jgi:hypothetical protein